MGLRMRCELELWKDRNTESKVDGLESLPVASTKGIKSESIVHLNALVLQSESIVHLNALVLGFCLFNFGLSPKAKEFL